MAQTFASEAEKLAVRYSPSMLFTRLRAMVRLSIFAVAELGYSAVPGGLKPNATIADAAEACVDPVRAGWRR